MTRHLRQGLARARRRRARSRELKVGDVITYRPPAGDHLITHRIAWIGRTTDGARLFRTKGDANAVADPWTFRLDRPAQARVRFGVPFAGYALSALGRRDVRLVLIALPRRADRRLQPRRPVAPPRRARGGGVSRIARSPCSRPSRSPPAASPPRAPTSPRPRSRPATRSPPAADFNTVAVSLARSGRDARRHGRAERHGVVRPRHRLGPARRRHRPARPTGSTICTDTGTPYGCSWNTTAGRRRQLRPARDGDRQRPATRARALRSGRTVDNNTLDGVARRTRAPT